MMLLWLATVWSLFHFCMFTFSNLRQYIFLQLIRVFLILSLDIVRATEGTTLLKLDTATEDFRELDPSVLNLKEVRLQLPGERQQWHRIQFSHDLQCSKMRWENCCIISELTIVLDSISFISELC